MSDPINRALSLYFGKGVGAYPQPDPARLFAYFKPEDATALTARIASIKDELYSVEPDWNRDDLGQACERAIAHIRALHPEIDEEGASALDWAYSYSYR